MRLKKGLFVLATAVAAMAASAAEPVAKAVWDPAGRVLSFVYDEQEYGVKGQDWFAVAEALSPLAPPPWQAVGAMATGVVFSASFADCRPQHCGNWFSGWRQLEGVAGLEHLDVSAATNLVAMFEYCSALGELDLTGFDTAQVRDFRRMFGGCANLRTVCASAAFVTTAAVRAGDDIFGGCWQLVGGNGTAYSDAQVAAERAVLDAFEHPGYFSLRGQVPETKAVLSADGRTLAFTFDSEDYGLKGTNWFSVAEAEVLSPAVLPPWHDAATNIEQVIFDAKFASRRPRHCGNWLNGCRKLTMVTDIRYLDVSAAGSLQGMFRDCAALTALELGYFDTRAVTNLTAMFSGCASLSLIRASERFSTAALDDPDAEVFGGCELLAGGNGTRWPDAGVSGRSARVDTAAAPGYFTLYERPLEAKAVLADAGATFRLVYDSAEYGIQGVDWFAVADAEQRATTTPPPWGYDEFRSAVRSIAIDGSFAAYWPSRCDYWFADFAGVTAVTGLANLNLSSATSLSSLFAGCGELTAMDAPLRTTGASNLNSLFRGCRKLASLDLSGVGVAWASDLGGMFEGCSALTELDLSGFDTARVKDLSRMFADDAKLVTVIASDDFVTTALAAHGGEDVFVGCLALRGGEGTACVAPNFGAEYACIDGGESAPGYFTRPEVPASDYDSWAAAKGLKGAEASWDAKPLRWGGEWANGFVYTFGEGLVDGSVSLLSIMMDSPGVPVITTAPVEEGHYDFGVQVVGSEFLDDWSVTVMLEQFGDDWWLPEGESAQYFRVELLR